MKTRKEWIEHIKANLASTEERARQNKVSKTLLAICRKDARRGIAEIRARPFGFYPGEDKRKSTLDAQPILCSLFSF